VFFGDHFCRAIEHGGGGSWTTGKRRVPSPSGEGQGEGINLRALRRQSSNAERVLWRDLRARRLLGYKFRRQVVIEPCIGDFACLEAGSIVEADGAQHSDQVACDARRTMQLEGMGYRVMPPHPDPLPGEREPGLKPPSPRPSPRGEGVRMHCQPTDFPEEPHFSHKNRSFMGRLFMGMNVVFCSSETFPRTAVALWPKSSPAGDGNIQVR
jgi:hypothetical protein